MLNNKESHIKKEESNIAIKSEHIYVSPFLPPISGYLLIKGEYIFDIIQTQNLGIQENKNLQEKFQIIDCSEDYIIPGLIDLNIHLNSTFESNWSEIENTTKMAIQGGITTLIDSPIYNKFENDLNNERTSLEKRKNKLISEIYADCGLLSYIGPHNYHKINDIWNENDILGFKMYLSPCFQPGLPSFELSNLRKMGGFLKKMKNNLDCLILVHPEYATSRDLFMSSPLRNNAIESRLDLNYDILDDSKFGGGIAGELEGNESGKEDDENDDDVFELIKNATKDEESLDQEIKSGALKRRSLTNSKKQEEQSISRLEMMGYSLNEEEMEAIRKCESDDELEFENASSSSEEEKDSFSPLRKSQFEINVESMKPKNKIVLTKNENSAMVKNAKNLDTRKSFRNNPLITGLRGVLSNLRAENEEEQTIEKEENDKSNDKNSSPTRNKSPSSLLQRRKQTNSPENKVKSEESPVKSLGFALNMKEIKYKDPAKKNDEKNNRDYIYFLYNHSLSWETNGVNLSITTFKNFSGKILLSNLSSSSSAFIIRDKKKIQPDLPIYSEIDIPYLYFHRKMIKSGETKYKNSPPIRDQETRNLIIEGLAIENLFHIIASGHLQPEIKLKKIDQGNFRRAINGISCVGANLNVIWSKIYSKYKHKNNSFDKIDELIKRIVLFTATNPAKLAKIDKFKGSLEKGKYADFVVWNPFKVITIKDEDIYLNYKKLYVFRNQKFYGEIKETYLRGKRVFAQNGKKFIKNGKILGREGII